MTRPLVLVTNDDGIDAVFLSVIADAFAQDFDIHVVAPATEQSWTGRSFSRYGTLEVKARPDLPWKAHTVSGTPSDCVNIALSHLVDRQPALIVSGMNIGYNVTLPLVMTSGTVAAAIEGAIWGIPALALSHAVPHNEFDGIKEGNPLTAERNAAIRSAARHAVRLTHVLKLIDTPVADEDVIVHNVNFPTVVNDDTPVVESQLAHIRLGGLFAPREDGSFSFSLPRSRDLMFHPDDADVACLKRGEISHTVINFAQLGRR